MTRDVQFTRREAISLFSLAALTGAAGLAGCSSDGSSKTATAGGSCTDTAIKLGTNGDCQNINPILAVDSDGYWRTDLMFDPMVLIDPKSLAPVPNLAKKWDISTDGKTYTFTLDPRAKFQDGSPLTSRDVEFTIMSMLDPGYTGPFQTYWARLEGADAVIKGSAKTLPGLQTPDDHTIKMVLSQPYAGFLTVIARQLKPLPAHLLEGKGPLTTSSPFSQRPVGSGQYQFKNWARGNLFAADANARYWQGAPCMKSITQTIIPDMNTLNQALVSGQLDASIVPPPSALPQLRQDSALHVYEVAPQYAEGLWFNLQRAPFKGNAKLRQAIAAGVDFVAFQKQFMYIKDPTPSSFYSYASWAYDAKAAAVPQYDPERAKSLLVEAGHPGGQGVEFEIITNAGNAYRAQEQTYVQAQLQKLGLKVSVKQSEWGDFISSVTKGNFDVAAISIGSAIPDPTALDFAFVTNGAINYGKYSNPEVDRLLAEAGAATDQAKRKELYSRVQAILAQDLPLIPSAWYPNYLVIKKTFGNVDPAVIGPYWNIGKYSSI